MTEARSFDAIVVGAGQAGPPLVARFAAEGKTVALIEREQLGGTCVNTGCTPTKTMVASAYAAHMARRAADFGVVIDGAIRVDMPAVMARKNKVVEASRSGLKDWIGGLDTATLIYGHARFTGTHTLAVNGETLTAPQIFLNVGGRASMPDIPGINDIEALTNSSILELTEAPQHLIIAGGSYIALEFAQMFRRFGSAITVLERGSRLMQKEDEDASQTVREILEAEGIDIRLNTTIKRFRRGDGGPVVTLGDGTELSASHVLIALGRTPNTDDLGLDIAGVEMNSHGFITVDYQLRTNVEGIFALGDCNGRGAFTHTSYNDFEIVAANLFDGANRKVSDRTGAYALYTDPPLGRAGMTLAEAKSKGHRVLLGKRPMTRVSRAKEKGEALGYMSVVVDADTNRILGGAIFGVGGDEAIHAILDAVQNGAAYTVLKDTMHIHPTVSELIPTILDELQPA